MTPAAGAREGRPRRRWRRWLGAAALALVALALAGLAAIYGVLWSSLPRTAGTIEVPGLAAPVSVSRDAYAIPHIEAASLFDAAFAQGFVHAQDRLFQMEFQRRLGAGRLAEIVGEQALGFDRFMRTLGFYRLAEASLAHLEERTRRWLEAYAGGVNAFLATREGFLPPEFLILRQIEIEPWRPADSLVWLKMMALNLSENWREEILRTELRARLAPEQIRDLWPDYPADAPVTLALGPELAQSLAAALPFLPGPGNGSNAWALAPARTTTGGAILANDPHLGMQAPGTWYLVRMTTPQRTLRGASLPGVPGIVLGHNDRIAWGLTTTGSDVQDLFIERIDPADAGRYLTPHGSKPFETRDETIRIRNAEPVILSVRRTRHGPVISDLGGGAAGLLDQGEVAALAWPALDQDDTTLQGLFKVMLAGGWSDFVAALEEIVTPQQNVFYADAGGRIGFYVPGRVPVRKAGDGRLPVPGWTGDYDWTGWIPFEALPHRLDPPDGELVNANNRVVAEDYPYLLATHWEAPYRARRITELLAGEGHDLASSAALQADVESMLARDLLPLMLEIEPLSERAGTALERLRTWDRMMTGDALEPLLFTAWYRAFAGLAYGDELGPLFDAFRRARGQFIERILTERTVWCDDVHTAEIERCPQVLAAALERALDELEAKFGADPASWRWGEAHRAAMVHPIFRSIPVLGAWFRIQPPTGGDGTSVNVGHPALRNDADPYANVHGPTYRGLYDLADPEKSRFIAATGQSGHPLSSHYDDLSSLWAAARTVPTAPHAAASARVLQLRPASGAVR
jgi:penicillin amidase